MGNLDRTAISQCKRKKEKNGIFSFFFFLESYQCIFLFCSLVVKSFYFHFLSLTVFLYFSSIFLSSVSSFFFSIVFCPFFFFLFLPYSASLSSPPIATLPLFSFPFILKRTQQHHHPIMIDEGRYYHKVQKRKKQQQNKKEMREKRRKQKITSHANIFYEVRHLSLWPSNHILYDVIRDAI